ncbi:MAG: peptidylprolyl isomerase [Acidobacteriota bacterium]|nr:peptidylprolyl isomerase [Acidobacteriota bacterium]
MYKIFPAFLFFCLTALPLLATDHPGLLDASKALNEKAPDTYRVKFETTKGDFTVLVTRDWSPNGADRFYNLVKMGYFKKISFFRVMEGFMAQFGIHGNPEVNKVWSERSFPDDPSKGISNKPGTLVFAHKGRPDTRGTQLYINIGDNANLDSMGFTPLGRLEGDGLGIILSLYSGYGDCMPRGRAPDQARAIKLGNAYIEKFWPNLDYIHNITIVE